MAQVLDTAAGATAGAELAVLVVEDDRSIADSLVRGLTRAGYAVRRASTGAEALAARPAPDVVLLDLGLPDLDGVEVCRRLRRRSDAAIIVVTARGEEADRVAALDEGADDYLVKPFGLAELLARLRAVLRRTRPGGSELIVHGPLTVDPRTQRVTVAGHDVALTPKEFDILRCLATDPGRVVTRQEILERAWDAHWYGPTKVLDVHIAALRKKLGVPGLVETVYGRGFRLGHPDAEPTPEPTGNEHPEDEQTGGHQTEGEPGDAEPGGVDPTADGPGAPDEAAGGAEPGSRP